MRLVMVHDRRQFKDRLSPAIAESVCRRSFKPLERLARELAPQFERLSREFHLSIDEQPLILQCDKLSFSRRLWRHLAGECLLYAAAETREFPVPEELLTRFVEPQLVERWVRGSRDVNFAGVIYRPGSAGMHDEADLAAIAADLRSIDCLTWTEAPLADVPPDERGDELALARQGFAELRRLFESARERRCVVCCEEL